MEAFVDLWLLLLTFATVSHGLPGSCSEWQRDAHKLGFTSNDGVYNVTVNGEDISVYCDMMTDGGGWTLLVAMVEGTNWTLQNILARNEQFPSLSADYSILGKADHIKALAETDHFQFALEATGRGRWGGRFSAPITYSLINHAPNQTDIQVLAKYDRWNFSVDSIGQRLPWIDLYHYCAILTTRNAVRNWWGTLVMKHCDEWEKYGPSPWVKTGSEYLTHTKPIYYWLRETVPDRSHKIYLHPTAETGATRRMSCDHVTWLADGDIETGLTLGGAKEPGCAASFSLNIASNDEVLNNIRVRIVGKDLIHENVLVSHGNTHSAPRGLFVMCEVDQEVNQINRDINKFTEANVLGFKCKMTIESVLHVVILAMEKKVKVAEIIVLGLQAV